jgi:hypothetical protein
MDRLSRWTFARNFDCQNALLRFGVVVNRELRCRCQKHPWTKIANFLRRFAMSGDPGRLRFECDIAEPQ